jgi:hypothetical protein
MELSFVMLLMLGGPGFPVGVPPLPEDPLISRVAPEECMLYFSWAGMAPADAASKNSTERLLAEQEVQQFARFVEKAIAGSLLRASRDFGLPGAAATEGPKLVKAILTRPTAGFIGGVTIGPRGVQIDGGMIVGTGEETAALMKSVAAIEELAGDSLKSVEIGGTVWKQPPLPPDAPKIYWGFKGKYFIVGIGEKSIENILKRARGEAPKWLTDVKKELAVERPCSLVYVDLKRMVTLASTTIPDPSVKTVLTALGLDKVTHLASVTGLDSTGCVTRTRLGIDGESTGLFALVEGKPLTAADLAVIPRDSSVAAAARLDMEKMYRGFRDLVGKVEPRAQESFDHEVKQFEAAVGLSLSDDLFKAVGDTWRVYNSPSDGGLVFTGLTAVATIRDRARLVNAFQKIEHLAQEEAKRVAGLDGPPRGNRHVTIKHIEFAKQTIYFLNFVGAESPFAPAWCVTDKELVLSLFPSHIKGYLMRGATPGKSTGTLADLPEVKAALAEGNGPTMIAYYDAKEIFKTVYPIVQIAAQFATSEMQRQGVEVDISMIPSAAVIGRHLQPGVSTMRRTEQGLELVTRQTLPMNLGPLPLFAPLSMFWVRSSARVVPPPAAIEKLEFVPDDRGGDARDALRRLRLRRSPRWESDRFFAS